MEKTNNNTVVFLAGGKSERMGFPKPWLSFSEEVSFLEHLVDFYVGLEFKNIVVVLNEKFCADNWKKQIVNIEQNALIVQNNQVEKGRMYSLKLGLEKSKDSDFVFIQNIDNPFVTKNVIDNLVQNAHAGGACIPTFKEKGGHPILISNTVVKHILDDFIPSATLRDVLKQFPQNRVEVENDSILLNINTPLDYNTKLMSK